jgi:ribosomal protein S18 acetylase RimI-like enzyme
MTLEITHAQSPKDIDLIRQLFIEYHNWLNEDVCFQNFQAELNNLPDGYECLLLAKYNGLICGAIGLTRLKDSDICEMKRLYVRPTFQRKGIGHALTLEIIQKAYEIGFTKVTLNTLPHLSPAIKMYEKLGFITPTLSPENPSNQVIYMEKILT